MGGAIWRRGGDFSTVSHEMTIQEHVRQYEESQSGGNMEEEAKCDTSYTSRTVGKDHFNGGLLTEW